MSDIEYILKYYNLTYYVSAKGIWKSKVVRKTKYDTHNCILYNPVWDDPDEFYSEHGMPFVASIYAYFNTWDESLKIYHARY